MNKRAFLTLAIYSTALAARASSGFHFADQPGEWWTMREVARYGGLIGGGVGGLAGVLGATAGVMVCRGKGRRFVVGAMTAFTVIGLGSLIAGVVALFGSQPWHVTYPLLLMGVILTAVCGSNTWMIRRMYVKVEMRQMVARDA